MVTSVDAATLVYVSNVTLDPSSFFPGDQGTVTVTLTNGGTSAIGLSHPDLMSSKLNVQANEWEGMSFVGAGSTITLLDQVHGKTTGRDLLRLVFRRDAKRQCHKLPDKDRCKLKQSHRCCHIETYLVCTRSRAECDAHPYEHPRRGNKKCRDNS